MANTIKKIAFPSTDVDLLQKQVDEINSQYHDYNKLHLAVDTTSQLIQISYTNDGEIDVILTGWLDMEQVGTYLKNYQRMFCLDPNRLDLFFEINKATAIVPISWLRPIRKRPKGIANAFTKMRQSYHGLMPRRKSISIKPSERHTGLFDIVDGNSTYFVAKQIGMVSIPCTIQSTIQNDQVDFIVR